MGARAWRYKCLCYQSRLLGLRNSLRSDSPRPQLDFGTGAQPRPQAPGGGAMRWRGYECLYLPYPLLTKEGKRKALDPRSGRG